MPLEHPPSDELTAVIRQVETGDGDAATRLWNHCFPTLLRYCRSKLPDPMRRMLDEEDIALSAFKSFCLGAQKGAFGDIRGRDEFWRLLYCIAGRKATRYLRYENRLKRGGKADPNNRDPAPNGAWHRDEILEQAESDESMVQFASYCQELFELLSDDNLRVIAILRIEGYSIAEIADRVGCAKRTVERRLKLIRQIWTESLDEAS